MKFKSIIALFLLVFSMNSFAQDQAVVVIKKTVAVDTSKYEIKYSLKFKNSISDKKYESDDRIVQIGKNYVKDYSEILFHCDSIGTECIPKGKTFLGLQQEIFPYEVLKYNVEKKYNIQYRTFNKLTISYDMPVKRQDWQLVADTSITVLGHHCNMAKVNYAGRTYTAWYAMDIPVHYGPFKFEGLPGLIMKIEDADKKYIWTVTGISNKHEPINRNVYQDTKVTTPEKANLAVRKMFKDPVAFSESTGTPVYKFVHGKLVRATGEPIPFEPIELE
jgi:GLPGLI family protein